MFIIPCPWCGDCAVNEFNYGGDAEAVRKEPAAAAGYETWFDYVYIRENPKGLHDEFWHHAAGCRQWLKVRRDTVTHEISKTCLAQQNLDELSS